LSVSDQNMARTNKDRLIGKQLGDYRITSRLASGGMARIYKAMDYKLQRPAALKVLEFDQFENDKTIALRFKREAQAVAALEHDNIITIYQYGEDEDEGVYFLAMKLVRGRDLADELRRIGRSKTKLMEIDRVLSIMGQIASALDYAHAQGIIHRDVKPSNILIDKDDKAILTDLGLVLRTQAETTMGTAFGTPRYIAPEQATSSDKAVPQSDIYAFAVILYELLTGQTPFDGDSPMEIALAHIGEPVPSLRELNPDIPEAVEKEILRALHKDPAQRHPTTTELMDRIRLAYCPPSERAEDAVGTRLIPENADQTLTIAPDIPPPTTTTRRRLTPLSALILVALTIAAAYIGNGLLANQVLPANAAGAPVTLIYDEYTFTIINEGDYTLAVQALKFVRGRDDDVDDYSGDRIPRDILPPDANCYQIVLANGTPSVPPQCQPIAQHRHGQETLQNPLRVPWRAESEANGRIASFEVRYAGQLVARCATVARGQNGECRFHWPVLPEPAE
jgi:serine/threonine protein kinase